MSNRLKILLVEDTRLDAEMFCELVKRNRDFHCDITVASSLSQAIAETEQQGFDLIVLDLNLADSRGLETYYRINQESDIPIVIYSGADDDLMAQEAVAHGAQDYIIKGEAKTLSLTRSLSFSLERSRRQSSERFLAEQRRELELIHQLQESLLPELPNLEFINATASAAIFPADRASGDYCDLIPLGKSSFICIVADVSGHGLRASQLMLTVRATLRAIVKYKSDPAEILLAADELLFDDFHIHHFVTMMIAAVDSVSGTVTFASAGHQGYLVRSNERHTVLEASCPPIGVVPLDPREIGHQQVQLAPGDLLFMPTDGLIEAENSESEPFGEQRMLRELSESRMSKPYELIHHLLKTVKEFQGDSIQQDDITMVCAKFDPTTDAANARNQG